MEKKIKLPKVVFDRNVNLEHHLSQAKTLNPAFSIHDSIDTDGTRAIDGYFTSHELWVFPIDNLLL